MSFRKSVHETARDPADRESWAAIVGFEGRYEVSSHGRVRNRRKRILSQHIDISVGYLNVTLYDQQLNRRPWRVHKLVTAAFRGPPCSGHCVNHIDGVKTNNHLSNLEYVTIAENTRHAIRIGISCSRSNGRKRSTLSEDDVREIRRLGASMNSSQIAPIFCVSPRTIRDILRRAVWRAVV